MCDFCHVSQNEDGGLEGEELLAFLKDLLERQGGSQKVFCLTWDTNWLKQYLNSQVLFNNCYKDSVFW